MIAIFLVFVLVLVQLKNIFFPDQGGALYGSRLDGIEKVAIKKNTLKEIENALSKEESIAQVSTFTKGRLLNVIITMQDDASKETAREMPAKTLEHLQEKQKKYYDIQVFLQKKNEDASFPILAYKHHAKDSFSFTKDR